MYEEKKTCFASETWRSFRDKVWCSPACSGSTATGDISLISGSSSSPFPLLHNFDPLYRPDLSINQSEFKRCPTKLLSIIMRK